jgi:hypothetical protein
MTPTITTNDHDKAVLDTLKDVHNRGAELYNAGEHAAAFRLYQGGLIVAKPFLAHREKQQAAIKEGLDQIERSQADAKLKAFRLHEVIEQIRTDLKDELKKKADRENPAEAAVTGSVAVAGMPTANIAIAFVPAKTTKPLATAKSADDGRFHISTTLPIGAYFVTLVGPGVPEHFAKPETTPLKADLKAGVNTLNFDAN